MAKSSMQNSARFTRTFFITQVYGRTEARVSMVPPRVHVRLSNHRATHMKCPLITAELQTGQVVWGKARQQ